MSTPSDPLRGAHSLSDPLRSFTWMLISLAVLFPIVNYHHFWTTAAVVSTVLLALALLVAPHSKVNVLYLTAFPKGRVTVSLRLKLAAILGHKFRLAAFLPPPAKPGFCRRFLLPYIRTKIYSGSRLTELQAGGDWPARLAKTLEKTRLVIIDAREIVEQAPEEVQLALATVGPERVVFLVDGTRSLDDWRQAVEAIAGSGAGQIHLLDVDSPRMKAELKALVKALPAGEAGASASGRKFVLAHATEAQIRQSRRISPFALFGWLVALVVLVLFPLLWGPVAAILAPMATVGVAVAIPLLILSVPLVRSLARDGRLLWSGHWFSAIVGLVTAAIAIFLAVKPQVITTKTVPHPSGEPVHVFSIGNTVRADAIAGDMQAIYDAEMSYSNVHFAKGFTCSFAELASDPASAQVLAQYAADPQLKADLPSGRHAGYNFAMASCPAMKVNGRLMYESIEVTAAPEQAGKGQKGFCLAVTPEARHLKADPKGGANCTEKLRLRF